jgi:hypothetical protein
MSVRNIRSAICHWNSVDGRAEAESRMVIRSLGAMILVLIVVSFVITSRRVCGCGSDMASAIGVLRAINSAEQTYAAACGAGAFAVDLADLAAPPSEGSAGFISPNLDHNEVVQRGYAFTIAAGADQARFPASGRPPSCAVAKHPLAASYFATAAPVGEQAGRPFLATDALGVIYQSSKPIANPIRPGREVVELR